MNGLNEVNIDIIKELCNISSGNALSSLINLTGLNLDIKVPTVKFIGFRELSKIFGREDEIITGVTQDVFGDIKASLVLGMDMTSSCILLKNMYSQFGMPIEGEIDFTNLNEEQMSMLLEIGSILAGSYITSLSNFVKAQTSLTAPCIATDMSGAILTQILCNLKSNPEQILLIGTTLCINNEIINTKIILLPEDGTLDYLISSVNEQYVNI